jgi:hypothetical protein
MANSYREELPDGCPPSEAEEINGPVDFFRLVKSNPATERDFISKKARFPKREFPGEECIARGLSGLDTQTAAEHVRRLPPWKNKRMLICRVRLSAGAGKIMRTRGPNHLTWWPYADYVILNCCEVVS